METCLLALLLAVTMTTGLAQDQCWDPKVEPTHKFCRDRVAKDKPATKDLENEKMWNCVMCKLQVFHHADDVLNFAKLEEVINTYVVEGKRQEMKTAVADCKPQYDSTKKIKDFYACYGPKLYQQICPS